MKRCVNIKKAYISGLGSMGRRHLKGLIKIGCKVEAYDPNETVFDIAKSELKRESLNLENLIKVDRPSENYDFAFFSETASSRFQNFKLFTDKSYAKKILLEKPLSSNPQEINSYLNIAKNKNIDKQIEVNFIRRSWPHIKKIFDYFKNEKEFIMTINGGAIGLGCNGIHFIDNFIFFSNNDAPAVKWVDLSENLIESGRGKEFYDFGANFVITSSKGKLLSSITANSSSNVILTIKGKHFIITVNYGNLTWNIMERRCSLDVPMYRYGLNYETVENGIFDIPNNDTFIKNWTQDNLKLPDLEIANLSHKCIEEILVNGGINPPYRFT